MANPITNPEKFLEDMYFTAQQYLLAPQTAKVYAIFGVAAGLFAIAAAIVKVAEALLAKK